MAYIRCGGGAEKPTLLWTNPSPSSSFSAQTLNINLTGYDYLIFEIKGYMGDTMGFIRDTCFDVSDEFGCICGTYGFDSTTFYDSARRINVTNSSIQFSDGIAGNGTESPAYCIPLKIYGLKKALI